MAVPQIENYKEHLAPLLNTFIVEPCRGRPCFNCPIDEPFTDEFGNSMGFGHTVPSCCGVPLLKLLRAGESGWVSIDDVDKGYLFYRLDVHSESYFMVYQLKVGLNGFDGKFDSFVILRSLDPLIQYLEGRIANPDIF